MSEKSIRLKGVVFDDFVQYKKPSLFLATCSCDFKCCVEAGIPQSVCQNEPLALAETREYPIELIYSVYTSNSITKSVVIGGLEPMLQVSEVIALVDYFRNHGCYDDFVIYTGYNRNEIESAIAELRKYENIIIKFGRFIPGHQPHYDDVLGIQLASDNQFAEKIS